MTKHRNYNPSLESLPNAPQQKLSDAELSGFLRSLAALYKSPITGNLPLSKALNDLALFVSKRAPISKVPSKLRKQKSPGEPSLDLSQLKALDIKAVEKFIADDTKTKLELMDLASARFSIPRAQLKRLKTSEVRETIKAASLHEASISIISEEARRDGSNRSS